jgi:hypothetical protein
MFLPLIAQTKQRTLMVAVLSTNSRGPTCAKPAEKLPEHSAVEGGKEATMRAFTIDADDNITALSSTEELRELKEGLVEIWNGLAGVQPVQKFTGRKTAVTRIWKASHGLGQGYVKQSATARPQPKAKKACGKPQQTGYSNQ